MGRSAVRPYTLVLVALLPMAALFGTLTVQPLARAQQSSGSVVVKPTPPTEGRSSAWATSDGRNRWTPQVIATSRPANEPAKDVVPVSAPPTGLPPIASVRDPITPKTPPGPAPSPRVLPGAAPSGLPALPLQTGDARAPIELAVPPVPLPHLLTEKIAPPSVTVGKPFTYDLVIKNRGRAPANAIRVEEALPRGSRWVGGEPRPEVAVSGSPLIWNLGPLAPGGETRIKIQVEATMPGEFSSTATISVPSSCVVRTRVLPPESAPLPPATPASPPTSPTNLLGLTVGVTGPAAVRTGETVPLKIELANGGKLAARRVLVRVQLPPGLQHPAGTAIEAEVDSPEPGQKSSLPLPATAAAAGRHTVEAFLVIDGAGELRSQTIVLVHDAAPVTPISLPPRLGEVQPLPAPGAIPARLPALDETPARASEPPVRRVGFASDSPTGSSGIPALTVDVVPREDPLEPGAETTYDIRVTNHGGGVAQEVQVSTTLPEGLTLLSAEGQGGRPITSGPINFDSVARVEPRGQLTYRIRAKAAKPGDWRFRVYVRCTQFARPEYKEVSTRVTSDRDPPRGAPRREGIRR